ncbi:(2Fe-2S)-binding protein [Nonomuraea sp. NPDC047529]|uniref:(2Fe-2S)-binding protein n=1 Tax=Nonomuraea sp. NPDC047529 TaxID=3155623 RepID=UPI0033C88860
MSSTAIPSPEPEPEPEPTRRAVIKAGAAIAALPAAPSRTRPDQAGKPVKGPGRVPLTVNGVTYERLLEPRVSLLDALRESIGLTGTKKGCDRGECGACTVLVDGRRIKSCLTLAIMQQGRDITTVEGLARGEELHPVQRAFIDQDGLQCGFCTPGQIMSAVACIAEGHAGDDAEVREWMSGNLCRCSCYPNIVAAVRQAAGELS